eukprot:1092782-Alexandrium_andersonii.AAC.1
MSASLVGSEMCIRDSRSALGGGRVTPAGRAKLACSANVLSHRVCRRTVSYTHLTLPTICSV